MVTGELPIGSGHGAESLGALQITDRLFERLQKQL